MKEAAKGYVYILTNPSFPQYIKIGYAKDVQHRLNSLNSSSAVPFAFRVYATYEVDSALSDKKLHAILDKLNPDLRTKEELNGKSRIREFYAMPPADAFAILEAIAEMTGTRHRLKLHQATAEEQQDEALAKTIDEVHQARLAPFSFKVCGIEKGEWVEFYRYVNKPSGIVAKVVDDKHVEYKGDTWSLSGLAKHLLNTTAARNGTKYFKYKGEFLDELYRKRVKS